MNDSVWMTGGVNVVRRAGSKVFRPFRPWSPAVQAFLRHLESKGLDQVPRALGFEQREECVSFLPGRVSAYPLSGFAADDLVLSKVAVLLRRIHDASTSFAWEEYDGQWQLPPQEPPEVMCHGDVAPYNVAVQADGAVALFDFDTTHPGPRVWDVAYAVYRWSTLTHPENPAGFGTTSARLRRARLFCDSYGLDDEARGALADTLIARLGSLIDFMVKQAGLGDRAYQNHLTEGHASAYERDIAFVREHRELISEALLAPFAVDS